MLENKPLYRPNIYIVLVEPITPGNIGSSGRAMKNMGFSNLRLAHPACSHLDPESISLAHGSEEILRNAQLFPSFKEAVRDCSILVGTSHKPRRHNRWGVDPKDIGAKLADLSQQNKIAVIFGRENSGLSNEEVDICHWMISIPAALSYPALNMAQAVMLVCYELFLSSCPPHVMPSPKLVSEENMVYLYNRLQKIIEAAGFRHKNGKPEIFMRSLRRIFGRAGLDSHDLQVLHKLCDQFSTLANLAASNTSLTEDGS